MCQTFDVFGINNVATNYQATEKILKIVCYPLHGFHIQHHVWIISHSTSLDKIIGDHLGNGRHIRM